MFFKRLQKTFIILKCVTYLLVLRLHDMTEMKNDIYYISKILNGETSYYTYIVDRYSKRLFSFIIKIIHNREDAEEVCQDVFIKAFRSLATFRMDSSFSTWIYSIAYNCTISATRKKKKEYLFISESQLINITEEDIAITLDGRSSEEQLVCLEMVLLKLPPEESSLITLFYIKEKSVKEVSLITGLSPANIKTRLHRIRKKMYLLLSKGIQL